MLLFGILCDKVTFHFFKKLKAQITIIVVENAYSEDVQDSANVDSDILPAIEMIEVVKNLSTFAR